MQREWDVVVVGAGPAAGLGAAAVIGKAGLSCLCLDRLGPGGMLINLGPIHHAPDLPSDTTGPDLLAQLVDRAMAAGAELAVAEVLRLEGRGPWTVETDDGTRRARAVIVATGLTAGQEAADLAAMAARVTVVCGDATPADTRAVEGLDNVEVTTGRLVALEQNDEGLQAVTVQSGGSRHTREAGAVFVYTGRTPVVSFVRTLLDLDASGHIMVDGKLCAGAPSLFAAGDVRAGASQRVADAMADGERAGRAAADLLQAAEGSKA